MNPHEVIGVAPEASLEEVESAYVEKFAALSRQGSFDLKSIETLVAAFEEIRKQEMLSRNAGFPNGLPRTNPILDFLNANARLPGGSSSSTIVPHFPEYALDFPEPHNQSNELMSLHSKLDSLGSELCGIKTDVVDIKKLILKDSTTGLSAATSISYLPRIISGGFQGLKSVLSLKRIGSKDDKEAEIESIPSYAQMPHALPIVKKIPVTLGEIYSGVVKKVRVLLDIQFPEGIRKVNRFLYMEIQRGAVDGDEIKRFRQVIEEPGKISGDLVFIVQEMPHERFVRSGNDLIYNLNVKREEESGPVLIELVDGSSQTIQIPEYENQIVIEGKGLPQKDTSTEYGNLVLNFLQN